MELAISLGVTVALLCVWALVWKKFKDTIRALGAGILERIVVLFEKIGRANWHRLPGVITLVVVYILGMEKPGLRYILWGYAMLLVALESVRMSYYEFQKRPDFMEKEWVSAFVEWAHPWHEKLFTIKFLRESERGTWSTSVAYAVGIAVGFEIFPIDVTACAVFALAFGDPGARQFGERYTGQWRLWNNKTLLGMLGFMIHGATAIFVADAICLSSGVFLLNMDVFCGQIAGLLVAALVETFLPRRLALFENGIITFAYAIPAWVVSFIILG